MKEISEADLDRRAQAGAMVSRRRSNVSVDLSPLLAEIKGLKEALLKAGLESGKINAIIAKELIRSNELDDKPGGRCKVTVVSRDENGGIESAMIEVMDD